MVISRSNGKLHNAASTVEFRLRLPWKYHSPALKPGPLKDYKPVLYYIVRTNTTLASAIGGFKPDVSP